MPLVYPNPLRTLRCLALAPLAIGQIAPTAPVSSETSSRSSDAVNLDDFVVTGVFNATEASKATTAISTLQRVEAVRGGSASITSSNSPGGAFNYISRIGTARFGGEVRARFGLEGESSPHYRADAVVSGSGTRSHESIERWRELTSTRNESCALTPVEPAAPPLLQEFDTNRESQNRCSNRCKRLPFSSSQPLTISVH